jgi:hypothetical protein
LLHSPVTSSHFGPNILLRTCCQTTTVHALPFIADLYKKKYKYLWISYRKATIIRKGSSSDPGEKDVKLARG